MTFACALFVVAVSLASAGCGDSTPPRAAVRAVGSTSTRAPLQGAPDPVISAFSGAIVNVPDVVDHTSASFDELMKTLGQAVPLPFEGRPTDIYFASGTFNARPTPGGGSVPDQPAAGVMKSVIVVTASDTGDVIFINVSPQDVTTSLPVDAQFTLS